MKRSLILLLSLINSPLLFAQNYTINWVNDKDYYFTNGEKIKTPYFENNNQFILNEFNQPQFIVELDGLYNQFNIKILNSKLLTSNEVKILQNSHLIEEKLRYTIQKKGNKTILSILPYVSVNQKIYRVEKLDIQPLSNRTLYSTNILDDSSTSVLKSGNWYKIKVNKTGVFKLDKQFFVKNGIPTTGYDLNNLKIYGNGSGRMMENLSDFRYGALQEIPIDFRGSEDNRFDDHDFIVFYAKGPHQFYRNSTTTLEDTFLRFNTYDDFSYYYITIDGNKGKRVESKSFSGSPIETFKIVDQYQFHKVDSININQMGREWVGNYLNGVQHFHKQFITNKLVKEENAYLRYSLVGKNAQNTNAEINVNNTKLVNVNFTGGTFEDKRNQVSFQPNQNNFNLQVKYTNTSNSAGQAFINYIELKYKEDLIYDNNQFNFRIFKDLNNNNLYAFNLSNSSNVTVWNVSDQTNYFKVNNSNGNFPYQSSSDLFQNEFVAFKDEHIYTDVEFSGKVSNQDIRGLRDISLVIITHPSLKKQAEGLARFREQYNNIKVAVVTTEEVYNDFSSGSKDPIAIRDFLKHLKDKGNPLEYAILFGSTTYDPKNRISNKSNLIPSFYSLNSANIDQSSTSDDYFVMFDVNNDMAQNHGNGVYLYNANSLELALGRIAASTISEAKVMVDKIISYYQKLPNKANSFGDWRTNIVMVSDDPEDDQKPYDVNTPGFDKEIDSVFRNSENKIYAVNKLYIDAYQPEQTSAGMRYPVINQSIINSIERGTNFLMYYGHGGPRSWAQERIITGEELDNLRNFSNTISRVPIVATITCDFTTWDLPQYNSAGELLLKNDQGGALSMITTNRPIGTTFGENLNGFILEELFKLENKQNQTTGKALLNAKKKYLPLSNDHSKVSLLGDPMVEVARPRQDIRITNVKVNGQDVDYSSHQIRALDFIEIEGEVLSANQSLDTSFSGNVQGVLFEKEVEKSLRNNKGFKTFEPYTFKEEFKTIFKGGSKVTNGKFVLKSYIPKDINYEVNFRKLLLYAYSNTSDAVFTDKLKVGGLNENRLNDNQPPQGKLYLNNVHFANGGIASSKPYLIACLTDDYGINSSGNSIGHDIVATLDGKIQESIVLNEHFTAGDGDQCINKNYEDYQKGQVGYQLNNLSLGNHTLELKFWDINNKSNTATLDFVVMENGSNQIQIDKLMNWPNPFTNNTFFHFEHNCDSELEVMVQIFSVAGRLVKTIRQTVSAEPFREGFRTGKYAIEWDGLDDFGDKIGKGTYIYKVNVKGLNSEICQGSATAIERLVILK